MIISTLLLSVSVVKVDLKNCKPDKFHKRLKERLSIIKTTLIIKWQPDEENICPSSIAKYFHECGCVVKECSNEFISRTEYSIKIPEFDNIEDAIDSEEMIEWLGMLCLGCNLENECPDDYISSYQSPQPNTVVGQTKILQWRGFFSSQEIKNLFDCIR